MAESGTILNGRYELIEPIGDGGMATIWRARDTVLGREVAVKLMRPEYGRDPDFVVRFRQEATSAASLADPTIVQVFDAGESSEGPFIVMELVAGEDLSSLLRRNGPLPPRQAARVAAEVAKALQAAHDQGIVHRDVKPGNILISRDGRVRVTDFGIARALAEAQLTLPGTTLGSVHYFSPEQAQGEPATPASDVYSLGIVLFEMLTGRRPWEGDNAAAVAVARVRTDAALPSSLRAGVPPDLDAIDTRALARDPSGRFPSAAAMADALEAFLAGRPATAAPAAGAALAAGAAAGVVAGAAATAASGAIAPAPFAPPAPSAAPVGASGQARSPGAYQDPGAAGGVPPTAPPGGGYPGGPVGAGRRDPEWDEPRRTGPWPWIAGLLALIVLAAAGFLGYRVLTGGAGASPAPGQVSVPSFVGRMYADAQTTAKGLGIEVIQKAFVKSSDQPEGTVTDQDVAAGTNVDKGSSVGLTVVSGKALVATPDLRNQPEQEAIRLIVAANLEPGTRDEAADPVVPKGSVIRQDPRAGLEVPTGTQVDYTVSTGPEATPTPSPSPTPTPTPSPEPTPTPTLTPEPTIAPSPTETLPVVGSYGCLSAPEAAVRIVADGFTLGTIDPPGAPAGWKVASQDPPAGSTAALNSPVSITLEDPALLPGCTP